MNEVLLIEAIVGAAFQCLLVQLGIYNLIALTSTKCPVVGAVASHSSSRSSQFAV